MIFFFVTLIFSMLLEEMWGQGTGRLKSTEKITACEKHPWAARLWEPWDSHHEKLHQYSRFVIEERV